MESFNQVAQWLESQQTHAFLIQKEENGDLDQVNLTLEKVTLGDMHQTDPDGYLTEHTILLHGEGDITTAGRQARLPQNVYEIPLEGTFKTRTAGNTLHIETSRANYTIRPNSPAQ